MNELMKFLLHMLIGVSIGLALVSVFFRKEDPSRPVFMGVVILIGLVASMITSLILNRLGL